MLEFPIVDSHIHLLDQKRFGYAWAAGAPALNRDWTPDDLYRAAKPYEFEGFVFVEVDVDMPQYLDEADWVDEIAKRDPRLKGAVVSSAIGARRGDRTRDRARRRIEDDARRPAPDPERARPGIHAPPGVSRGAQTAAEIQSGVRHLHLSSQLENTIEMVRRCPEVSFVLDHIGKPGIKAGLDRAMEDANRRAGEMPECRLQTLRRHDRSRTRRVDAASNCGPISIM